MNIDFSLLLVLITLACGIIWFIGSLIFRKPQSVLVEYARSFFPLLLLVLVLRSFVFEPFRIPSGSMKPTLLVGDFILVNKFAYGVRLPVIHKKILDTGAPERGDVAVFRYPLDPRLDYIKRIVGVPGDVLQYRDKKLSVNGVAASQELLGDYDDPDGGRQSTIEIVEDLIGVEHRILNTRNARNGDFEIKVPEGMYFAMGDNRDNSNDSRYWRFVPEDHLVGKAFMVWMHFNWNNGGFKLGRVGDGIH
jgi:signal peptidase I